MELSVVIPAHNERRRLPKTLKRVHEYLLKENIDGEIIVADSASTDKTADFVNSFESSVPLKLVKVSQKGKGLAVKEGVLASKGNWVIFMDADNSTDLSDIELLNPYKKDYEVIVGSRYAGIEIEVKQSILRRVVSRAGAVLVRMLTGLKMWDTQCGFKLFSNRAAMAIFGPLESHGWGFDVEVLLRAKKLGFKMIEVPVHWKDAEGSHLRSGLDSIKTLIEVLKIKRRLVHELKKS